MGNYRVCLCFTRKFHWKDPSPPPAVVSVFSDYSGGGNLMTPDQLRRFLAEFQGEKQASLSDAERLVDSVRGRRGRPGKAAKAGLSLDDFYQLLFAVDLNPAIGNKVHQDMSAPVSQYYIYTGHNSYLTGNQLSSDCSDVPIVKALQRGVRVIELDMWPNSAKDDINILHGRTLTSPVQLIKCLQSIREHAFKVSPYPVVITLEDHLTPDLQAKAAEMITETFGGMLFYPETENVDEFPSLESLKHRILISTKPPKEYLDTKKETYSQTLGETPDDEQWGVEISDSKLDSDILNKNDYDQGEQMSEEEDVDDDSKVPMDAAPKYRSLITIPAGKPKGGMKEALKVEPNKVRRLSLSEQQLRKATISHGDDVIRFTKRNLLRIYPKGTRFTSSNYNPFNGWMYGAQMVAFNMQGYGRSLWLMHGFFRANGGCGFVKKPDFLSAGNKDAFNPMGDLPVRRNLKVTVYMGDGWRMDFKQTHFDTYSPPDFYTRVGIAGVPRDSVMKKTKIIEDDWTPVWNEEFIFPLFVPEIAVLRIEVHEYDMSEKDDFGGQTCLPVSELRTGIRAVPLYDRKGEQYKSVKLLMRFEFC